MRFKFGDGLQRVVAGQSAFNEKRIPIVILAMHRPNGFRESYVVMGHDLNDRQRLPSHQGAADVR